MSAKDGSSSAAGISEPRDRDGSKEELSITRSSPGPDAHLFFDASSFSRHDRLLHHYLTRRLRLRQDADDLTQEVYLRLLRRSLASPIHKPLAYLYGIAAHVLAEFRARGDRERQSLSIDNPATGFSNENSEEIAADYLIDALELWERIDHVLGTLPPTHAAVLVAHKLEGLSYREVAERLNLSVHTVAKYVAQAKAMIKRNAV